jgi:hypothetical protein
MRVFNLCCEHGHAFEGWFRSGEDFDSQLAQGMLACPICDSPSIEKKLSAPAVLRGGLSRQPASESLRQTASEEQTTVSAELMKDVLSHPKFAQLRAEFAKHVRQNTEDVGARFAEEARAMHYDEKPSRSIRGQATRDETLALVEEGIEVLPLPFRVDPPELH